MLPAARGSRSGGRIRRDATSAAATRQVPASVANGVKAPADSSRGTNGARRQPARELLTGHQPGVGAAQCPALDQGGQQGRGGVAEERLQGGEREGEGRSAEWASDGSGRVPLGTRPV
ncbi:hypothetical protein Srubr_14780 [Streptomyces rubradiris]|uniref:Uncharacterized protein n=1 Tax=Streptomyces rubradiris TaxID=285531 RepID=A0ABQ3R730_STRRR|nr:hypothetical protein GCM10018792_48020 [Streptomyces rubradiris]GHI51632.1 hypothetical protein Srubr_14780 [Streptomyces rubradiris]